jgi:toxin HigB-1
MTGACYDPRRDDARRSPDPAGEHLEKLAGDRKAQHSIRINQQWRVCFEWRADGAHGVEVVDYHA